MHLQGKITRWDNERGFGFISSPGDGNSVFVHIKAFPRESRQPEVGDIVSYQMAKDKNGRPRAEKARFAEQSKTKNASTHRHQSNPLPVYVALLLLWIILVTAYLGGVFWLVLVIYSAASLLPFFAYAWDKSSARRGNWRTPESTLHLMALVGGWPGALSAQRLLRHKSSKKEFLLIFWLTVFLNVIAIGCIAWITNFGSII